MTTIHGLCLRELPESISIESIQPSIFGQHPNSLDLWTDRVTIILSVYWVLRNPEVLPAHHTVIAAMQILRVGMDKGKTVLLERCFGLVEKLYVFSGVWEKLDALKSEFTLFVGLGERW